MNPVSKYGCPLNCLKMKQIVNNSIAVVVHVNESNFS